MRLFTLLATRPRSASPRVLARRKRLYLEALESRTLLDCEPILWNQHVDVEVEYEDGQLAMKVHDNDTDETCNPDETILYVGPTTLTTQPEGWDFIGAGAGNPFWRLPQIRIDPDVLLLGGGAEEIDPAEFDAYRPADPRVSSRTEWIKVTLRELYAPGHISVWRDGQPPNQWWVSSFDGGRTYEPAFYMAAGAHTDFNWGFTAPGFYVVGFEATAFQGGSGLPLRSEVAYYQFYVDDGMGSPGGFGGDSLIVRALTVTLPVTPALAGAPASQRPEGPAPVEEVFAARATEPQPALTAPGHKALGQRDHLFADLLHGDALFS